MRALNFVTGPHTPRTGDTGSIVEGEERIRVVTHGGALLVRSIRIPNPIDTACEGQFAQRLRYFAVFRLFR
jgi:hypothetical protein